jgi:hypothetical protein
MEIKKKEREREWLERIFLPMRQVDRDMVLGEAQKCVEKIHQIYGEPLTENNGTMLYQVMQMAQRTGDLTYAQAIFLFCIPQFEVMTDELFQGVPLGRRQAFIQELVYRRQILLDGLTQHHKECKVASDLFFVDVRAFVHHMRMFYLTKPDHVDPEGYETKRLPAEWDSIEAFSSADCGTIYFGIVSILLHSKMLEDYSNFQPHNRPPLETSYGDPLRDQVLVKRETCPGPSVPLTNQRDLCRGLDAHKLLFFKWQHFIKNGANAPFLLLSSPLANIKKGP